MTQTSDKTIPEQAKDAARDMADDVADAATAKAKQEAEIARDMAADETDTVANAAHAAADEFGSGSMQAQALEEVAKQVDRLATQIRNTDIDRVARLIGDTAQRNPLAFVAGAALAGFAATRFLNARGPDRTQSFSHDDPWQTSHRSPYGSYDSDPTSQRGV